MSKIPKYYVGKYRKIKVKDVCDDFELSYHLGSATKYICRAYNKHETPDACIKKAIHHLNFELDKLQKERNHQLAEKLTDIATSTDGKDHTYNN